MKDIATTILAFLLSIGFLILFFSFVKIELRKPDTYVLGVACVALFCISAFWFYDKLKSNNKNEPGLTEIKCDECNGFGKVTYDKSHIMVINKFAEPGTYTCPMCSGDGKLLLDNRK